MAAADCLGPATPVRPADEEIGHSDGLARRAQADDAAPGAVLRARKCGVRSPAMVRRPRPFSSYSETSVASVARGIERRRVAVELERDPVRPPALLELARAKHRRERVHVSPRTG